MVHIQTGTVEDFIAKNNGKKVICFGAGEHFDYILGQFSKEGLYRQIAAVADNRKELWGKTKRFKEKEYPIISFAELCDSAKQEKPVIIITNHWHFNEIIGQMDQAYPLDGAEVYLSDLFVRPMVKYPPFEIRKGTEQKIPKKIHYCWFGKEPIPAKYRTYMESWGRYCPDYEITLWNENNYDVTKSRYMKQAYDKGMWAFVSDYARADIVCRYGGIYLDCDVELRKPPDSLLGENMYCGFEDYRNINLGLGFGACAGHPYLQSLLRYYEDLEFIGQNGEMNLKACPYYQTEVIKRFGIVPENRFQHTDEITVYPTEVFSPYSYWDIGKVTDKTYSIHHYSGSWKEEDDKSRFVQWKMQFREVYKRIEAQKEKEKP